LGCNNVFLVGQKVDQMGQMLKKYGWRNCQKKAQEGLMPFYYCSKSFVSKMVSSQRSQTIGEEKT